VTRNVIENDEFLLKIIAISTHAGSLILEWYENEPCQFINKVNLSPFTGADLASDAIIELSISDGRCYIDQLNILSSKGVKIQTD